MEKYRKFWVALVTALAMSVTLLIDLFGPQASQVVTIILGFAGALGVYAVPNATQPIDHETDLPL